VHAVEEASNVAYTHAQWRCVFVGDCVCIDEEETGGNPAPAEESKEVSGFTGITISASASTHRTGRSLDLHRRSPRDSVVARALKRTLLMLGFCLSQNSFRT
jgi:hypothetical protein